MRVYILIRMHIYIYIYILIRVLYINKGIYIYIFLCVYIYSCFCSSSPSPRRELPQRDRWGRRVCVWGVSMQIDHKNTKKYAKSGFRTNPDFWVLHFVYEKFG